MSDIIKQRTCLKCDALFLSMGPGHRLCPKHRGKVRDENRGNHSLCGTHAGIYRPEKE